MGQRWNLCPETPESIAILGPPSPKHTFSLVDGGELCREEERGRE